jgi:hypothetical protein
MKRGEVRWYLFSRPDKKRPVLILTRDSALEFLGEVTVAPITTPQHLKMRPKKACPDNIYRKQKSHHTPASGQPERLALNSSVHCPLRETFGARFRPQFRREALSMVGNAGYNATTTTPNNPVKKVLDFFRPDFLCSQASID